MGMGRFLLGSLTCGGRDSKAGLGDLSSGS